MSLWDVFQAAGGIAIPWRMATTNGADTYSELPGVTARAILFHTPTAHMGAVDPTQAPAEQAQQWARLAADVVDCETCSRIDWASVPIGELPLFGVGYVGFFDEVPAARDLDSSH
jgi:hypothetical protein